MSKEVEKKFRVKSFEPILKAIEVIGARPTIDISSTHYYAQLDSDDTLKMIDYGDKIEIHRLSTKNGLHTLEEIIPIIDIPTGLHWFSENGYDTLEVLTMHDREFAYKNGGFALYTINSEICSVILGYPETSLNEMEAALELNSAEQITLPYNKYIAQLGASKTISTGD